LKLARLWQPRSGLFWQMVAFNVLSSLCGWALRSLPLNTTGLLLVGCLGLANCGYGMLAAWRLLRTPAEGERGPVQGGGGSSASTASTSE
jgi:hypothetical protein